MPLYLIPYDDNLDVTRRAAKAYGVTIVEEEPRAIDRLAADLYPLFPGYRRRLRKLCALALPLDEVIYIDVDIVLFRDMTPLFGHLKKGETDFIVASPSFEYVYNKKKDDHDFLKNALLFNDGFFLTSNKILDLDMFIRHDRARCETVPFGAQARHAVRAAGREFRLPPQQSGDPDRHGCRADRLARDLLQGDRRDLERRRAARSGGPRNLFLPLGGRAERACPRTGRSTPPGRNSRQARAQRLRL